MAITLSKSYSIAVLGKGYPNLFGPAVMLQLVLAANNSTPKNMAKIASETHFRDYQAQPLTITPAITPDPTINKHECSPSHTNPTPG